MGVTESSGSFFGFESVPTVLKPFTLSTDAELDYAFKTVLVREWCPTCNNIHKTSYLFTLSDSGNPCGI